MDEVLKRLRRRDFLRLLGGLSGILTFETLTRCEGKEPITPTPEWKPPPTLQDLFPQGSLTYEEKWVPTTCWIGKQDCSMLARVLTQKVKVNGQEKEIKRVVSLKGLMLENGELYNPRNYGTLCPKGVGQITALYDYNRIKTPLKRINKKGEPGMFVEISWDEALNIIKDKLLEKKARGEYILWQKGRSKSEAIYDNAFVNALKKFGIKTYKVGHGAFCSDAGYKAVEYTLGLHAVVHPDWKHTKYVISMANLLEGGGNKLCYITWPRMMVEAKKRGVKIVQLGPLERPAGPYADEWIPIKPGTDMAFFLGISYYLLKNRYIDSEYLKKYTNAPFLVDKDGFFVLNPDNNKQQIWDTKTSSVKDYDSPDVDPDLFYEGKVKIGNEEKEVKTALKLFEDYLEKEGYTPDWADKVCGITPGTTSWVARELWENSGIAEDLKITIDNITFPLRPVSFALYHVPQTELGFQMTRSAVIAFMLLGAIDVPGGIMVDFAPTSKHSNYDKHAGVKIEDKKYDYTLTGSKFFPITSPNPSFLARVMLDPTRYNVDEKTLPRVAFVHMASILTGFTDAPALKKAWEKFELVVFLTPWYTPSVDLLADIVLPASTLEKYEGPFKGNTPYETTDTLRIPVMDSLFSSKGEIEIYLDIAERVGFLDKFIEEINNELKIKDEYKLPTGTKPTVRQIFDAWAKSLGKEGVNGIEYFETKGVTKPKKYGASEVYAWAKKYFGIRHRLYGEELLQYQKKMKELGMDKYSIYGTKWDYSRDYTPFPKWREITCEKSTEYGYDLYLISGKKIEFKQSRTFLPLLMEYLPYVVLIMNTKTAEEKGIKDGDIVFVESHNAITGETRRIKARVELRETIRPDTVYIPHSYNPRAGVIYNSLFFATEGYVQCTQDQSFLVKVKVYKSGGDVK